MLSRVTARWPSILALFGALSLAPSCGYHAEPSHAGSDLGHELGPDQDPAQDVGALDGNELVHAQLLCTDDALVPGSTTTLGLQLKMDEGWHVYSHAANDSGYPPQLAFDLPAGLSLGETAWPAPQRHVSPGDILDHVYYDEVTLLLPLEVSPDLPPGEVALSLDVEWLVCETFCLIGTDELSLTLPVLAPGGRPGEGGGAAAIAASRARLPLAAPPGLTATLDAERATLSLPGAKALAFFPALDCVPLADVLGEAEAEGERLSLTRADRGPGGDRLVGVLAVTPADGATRYHAVEHPPRPRDD
jgi:thiol:disulfide interchange protein DsbD